MNAKSHINMNLYGKSYKRNIQESHPLTYSHNKYFTKHLLYVRLCVRCWNYKRGHFSCTLHIVEINVHWSRVQQCQTAAEMTSSRKIPYQRCHPSKWHLGWSLGEARGVASWEGWSKSNPGYRNSMGSSLTWQQCTKYKQLTNGDVATKREHRTQGPWQSQVAGWEFDHGKMAVTMFVFSDAWASFVLPVLWLLCIKGRLKNPSQDGKMQMRPCVARTVAGDCGGRKSGVQTVCVWRGYNLSRDWAGRLNVSLLWASISRRRLPCRCHSILRLWTDVLHLSERGKKTETEVSEV